MKLKYLAKTSMKVVFEIQNIQPLKVLEMNQHAADLAFKKELWIQAIS